MRNKLCLLLILINLISIVVVVYISKYVYFGIYNTVLFWGMNLYVLTLSSIMFINNNKYDALIYINIGITFLSILWFFYYMPEYTPNKAIEKLKNSSGFDNSYNFYIDDERPTQSANISNFIRGIYRIKAEGSTDFIIRFDPYDGRYDKIFEKDDISKNGLIENDSNEEIDILFREDISKCQSTADDIIRIIDKYANMWNEEIKRNYDLIYNILDDENKRAFYKEHIEWESYVKGYINMKAKLYVAKYEDGDKLLIKKSKITYDAYRDRALKLKEIYNNLIEG